MLGRAKGVPAGMAGDWTWRSSQARRRRSQRGSARMADPGMETIGVLRTKVADFHQRAAKVIGRLSDADLNWRPNEESNSVANLVVHLAGNVHEYLEAAVGGVPDTRDRDAEFNDRAPRSRAEILERLAALVASADGILAQLTPARLGEVLSVRGRERTVLDVIVHVVTHLGEHVGQILYIAKLRQGPAYEVVSIPHRKQTVPPQG